MVSQTFNRLPLPTFL